jgi:TetR/AcrR family transcriptional regulator, regulator of cefoperazone and chloramphenicol sensitivity
VVQARLLDIAVREFGSKGLEGVSTRDIAAAAGTAMSSITYHYGGKDGLYLAAADHIAAEMGSKMGTALDGEPPADAAAAREDVHRLLGRLAEHLIGDDDDDGWSLFILREQMRPSEAFERIYAGPMGDMATRLVSSVEHATGADPDEARIAAMMLFGQVLIWRASRALAERVIGRAVDADAAAAIRRRLLEQTDCILDRLSDPKEPQ